MTGQTMASSSEKRSVTPNDSELLMRFVRYRDEDAFEQLVVKHGPLVMGTCRHILRHQQDVEDAFQATFLVLAKRSQTIRRTHSLGTWLYSVAYRTAMRTAKKRSDLKHEPLADTPTTTGDVLAEIQDIEWRRILMDEIERLPERFRTPLVLCYLEGKSQKEVAEETDCSKAAVKARLTRGRRMLRVRLIRRGVALSYAMHALSGSIEPAEVPPSFVGDVIESALSQPLGVSVSQSSLALTRQEVTDMTVRMIQRNALVAAAVSILAVVLASGVRAPSFSSYAAAGQEESQEVVVKSEVASTSSRAMQPVAILQSADANRSVQKHRLRFRGKTFIEWREIVETELDAGERAKALQALSNFGTHGFEDELFEAVEPLVAGASVDVRYSAMRALAAAGPRAVPVLVAAIRDARESGWNSQMEVATEVLGAFGRQAQSAIPTIVEVLNSSDSIRLDHIAARALGRIGVRNDAVLAALSKPLKESHTPIVRDSAAVAIAKIGTPTDIRDVAPHLLRVLDDDNLDNVVAAIDALGQAKVKEALPKLEELAKDGARSGGHYAATRADVKKHAQKALEQIGKE